MSETVPAEVPDQPAVHLDDPTEDRLRDIRSVAELVTTDTKGGYDVPTEPV
jgi:hypothetical protein